jgi:hypothetical protein
MKTSPLSREFALTVAGWTSFPVRDEDTGATWEFWKNENGMMVSPPMFAESLDLIKSFLPEFVLIGKNAASDWTVVFDTASSRAAGSPPAVSKSSPNLSEAIAAALIELKKGRQ